jgi:DMSO reductase anchor subunit
MVIMPINALLGFADGLNIYLGSIVGLAVNIFTIWLLFNALVGALKAKPDTSKTVSYVLIALFVLFTIVGLGAKKKANQFMNEFNKSDMKELLKDLEE